MCGATRGVCFGPEADMPFSDSFEYALPLNPLTKKETAEVHGGFFQYGKRSCALVEVSS